MFNFKKFALTFAASVLFMLFVSSLSMGYSTLDNSLHFGDGLNTVWGLFGGITSFGALVSVIVGISIAVFGLVFMTNNNYAGKVKTQIAHVSIALAALLAAALIGLRWFKMPSGAGWTMLVAIAILVGFTLLVMWINRSRLTVRPITQAHQGTQTTTA